MKKLTQSYTTCPYSTTYTTSIYLCIYTDLHCHWLFFRQSSCYAASKSSSHQFVYSHFQSVRRKYSQTVCKIPLFLILNSRLVVFCHHCHVYTASSVIFFFLIFYYSTYLFSAIALFQRISVSFICWFFANRESCLSMEYTYTHTYGRAVYIFIASPNIKTSK